MGIVLIKLFSPISSLPLQETTSARTAWNQSHLSYLKKKKNKKKNKKKKKKKTKKKQKKTKTKKKQRQAIHNVVPPYMLL